MAECYGEESEKGFAAIHDGEGPQGAGGWLHCHPQRSDSSPCLPGSLSGRRACERDRHRRTFTSPRLVSGGLRPRPPSLGRVGGGRMPAQPGQSLQSQAVGKPCPRHQGQEASPAGLLASIREAADELRDQWGGGHCQWGVPFTLVLLFPLHGTLRPAEPPEDIRGPPHLRRPWAGCAEVHHGDPCLLGLPAESHWSR